MPATRARPVHGLTSYSHGLAIGALGFVPPTGSVFEDVARGPEGEGLQHSRAGAQELAVELSDRYGMVEKDLGYLVVAAHVYALLELD